MIVTQDIKKLRMDSTYNTSRMTTVGVVHLVKQRLQVSYGVFNRGPNQYSGHPFDQALQWRLAGLGPWSQLR